MDSVLDRLFAWFRGPEKKEEDSVSHEEHAPHEAAEEHEVRREEPFNAFRHEEYAPHEAAEEHEAEEEEPDALFPRGFDASRNWWFRHSTRGYILVVFHRYLHHRPLN